MEWLLSQYITFDGKRFYVRSIYSFRITGFPQTDDDFYEYVKSLLFEVQRNRLNTPIRVKNKFQWSYEAKVKEYIFFNDDNSAVYGRFARSIRYTKGLYGKTGLYTRIKNLINFIRTHTNTQNRLKWARSKKEKELAEIRLKKTNKLLNSLINEKVKNVYQKHKSNLIVKEIYLKTYKDVNSKKFRNWNTWNYDANKIIANFRLKKIVRMAWFYFRSDRAFLPYKNRVLPSEKKIKVMPFGAKKFQNSVKPILRNKFSNYFLNNTGFTERITYLNDIENILLNKSIGKHATTGEQFLLHLTEINGILNMLCIVTIIIIILLIKFIVTEVIKYSGSKREDF